MSWAEEKRSEEGCLVERMEFRLGSVRDSTPKRDLSFSLLLSLGWRPVEGRVGMYLLRVSTQSKRSCLVEAWSS